MKYFILLITLSLFSFQCKEKEKTEIDKAHSHSSYKNMTDEKAPAKNFVMSRMNDPEMDKAMEEAKKSIDTFIKNLKNKKESQKNFTVKVKIKDGKNAEHLWISDVKYDKGKFKGILNNRPFVIQSVKIGDEITAEKDDVSDWMFVEGDKMIGGYTSRLLINRMPPEQKKHFLEQMNFKLE